MKMALKRAARLADIDHVNAHGISTLAMRSSFTRQRLFGNATGKLLMSPT
jgi:3-oxoacyl-(acyl-carrier-protein) synthase